MPRFHEPAFILRTWDLGESDLLVSFFSPERGKRRGVAKAAKKSRKRFGGILSPLFLVELEYFEKPGAALVRLEGCSLLRYYASFPSSLAKLLVGCCLLEILERVLQEGEASEQFFLLLGETLDRMDREPVVGSFLWVFVLKALSLLGMEPRLAGCIHCERPLATSGVFGYSVPLAGPVCGGCISRGTSTHRLHYETLRVMGNWLKQPCAQVGVAGVPKGVLREAEVILESLFVHHVAREFRSLRVMREVQEKRKKRNAEEKGRIS